MLSGRMLKTVLSLSLLALGVCALPATTWAQQVQNLPPGFGVGATPLRLSIDENGVAILNGMRLSPLSPTGIPMFSLGQLVVAGDVIFNDPEGREQLIHPLISDILRFPDLGGDRLGWANTVQFLSDVSDGAENSGDVAFPALQANTLTLTEDVSEVTTYMTGIVNSPHQNVYTVFSDVGITVVPEPGTLSLLATGGLPLLGFLRRRRGAAASL